MADKSMNLRQFQRIQRSLAYRAAVDVIESSTACLDRLVYDLAEVGAEAAACVDDAVRWLETYGLVERDPLRPSLITILDEDAVERGLARVPEYEALELADKVRLIEAPGYGGVLEVDGVKFAFDALVALVNPDPNRLLRIERKGDELIVHQHDMYDPGVA